MNTRFMKTISLRAALLLGCLGALTVAANAQSPVTRAKIPFEFAAAGAMLPAGDYSVEVSDLSGIILLRGSSGMSLALLSTFSGAPYNTSATRLVFDRRDGMAYLSGVEWPGASARVVSLLMPRKGAVAAALH